MSAESSAGHGLEVPTDDAVKGGPARNPGDRSTPPTPPTPSTPLLPGGLVLPGIDLSEAPACGPEGC